MLNREEQNLVTGVFSRNTFTTLNSRCIDLWTDRKWFAILEISLIHSLWAICCFFYRIFIPFGKTNFSISYSRFAYIFQIPKTNTKSSFRIFREFLSPYLVHFKTLSLDVIYFCIHFLLSDKIDTAISINATRPNGSVGRSRGLLHVPNPWLRRFFFLLRHG